MLLIPPHYLEMQLIVFGDFVQIHFQDTASRCSNIITCKVYRSYFKSKLTNSDKFATPTVIPPESAKTPSLSFGC